MLIAGSDDNSHLLDRLQVKSGELVQALLPGAMIRGWVQSIEDGGATLVLKNTDQPPITWAINARQLIAAGRIGHA